MIGDDAIRTLLLLLLLFFCFLFLFFLIFLYFLIHLRLLVYCVVFKTTETMYWHTILSNIILY